MKKYAVIGLMSGTSLDGLDIAYVEFANENQWSFEVIQCKTLEYESELVAKLKDADQLSALALRQLDVELGKWIGKKVKQFMIADNISPDLIASHGHTVFHQPEIGITMQIGDGNQIMLETGTKTICDFRAMDVANGGQGAPLVPIGDMLLFSKYDLCLNLGGFSNVSMDHQGERIAFDVCPVNTVLNHFSAKLGFKYDDGGKIARSGTVNQEMLEKLNLLSYYHQSFPKSLGIEWVNENVFPILVGDTTENIMTTYCQHAAVQINNAVSHMLNSQKSSTTMLITGGGAHHRFLIELIEKLAPENLDIVLPPNEIIDFKEAIIFAFLGLLRDLKQINILKSVTGAKSNSSGGIIFERLIA